MMMSTTRIANTGWSGFRELKHLTKTERTWRRKLKPNKIRKSLNLYSRHLLPRMWIFWVCESSLNIFIANWPWHAYIYPVLSHSFFFFWVIQYFLWEIASREEYIKQSLHHHFFLSSGFRWRWSHHFHCHGFLIKPFFLNSIQLVPKES